MIEGNWQVEVRIFVDPGEPDAIPDLLNSPEDGRRLPVFANKSTTLTHGEWAIGIVPQSTM